MANLHFAEARKFFVESQEGEFSPDALKFWLKILTILEHGCESPTPSGPPMEVGKYEVGWHEGNIVLYVKSFGCSYVLLWIRPDGKLLLRPNLAPSLGFALDAQGRVQMTDGG